MSHFDAKILDADTDGAVLLAAVLHTVPGGRPEAGKQDRQHVSRAGAFADVFVSSSRDDRPVRRAVRIA